MSNDGDDTARTHAVSERIGPGSVSVARTGDRTFEGLNERGATIRIGHAEAEGHFTPGELLKLALAACAGMSADRVIARRLGEDVSYTVWAHGTSEPDNRYDRVVEELLLPLGELDADERAKLERLIDASIERSCTVARSVEQDIDLEREIVDLDA
ncbi:putative OsmC-like protein [Agromyces terreus]|uniref:OsmC-like protein n=1 Tax=Agromyces terreus TaxID=424795 RepID=A0A9X2H1Z2_9MICO|nr:OsmC family protein [Agromyces terreus]MCP2371118.1 putative OsmC-like protein [Agromyces terreus]